MTTSNYPATFISQIDDLVALAPVIPVLKIEHLEDAVPLAQALVDGGLPVLEITLRSDAALDAIRAIAEHVPEARVGAGTVTNTANLQAAIDAGSEFVFTPGATPALLAGAIAANIPMVPGIQTVSEMMTAMDFGYRRFKFFPAAAAGGTAILKSIAGPFPEVRFCPTGGIRPGNANDYLSLGNVMCVGGTWLTPDELIAAKDWDAIRELARSASNLRG
ncbi:MULTISPECIES: bifunctional 4-hydroxy-2-oxoglutarate aldolase/2-dehydro-3-deoxy-phosphogluconate aldolase [unclassified Oceanobacter]|uniref:bifunctional 4-hydroxy-2-oxoglutarate aldolase/2-dehydro-3-deoxy-phosphogluconate aldolase n=1 Tax=unclassified Oceanobacter TaxID=2620260 RepID=UPI0026E3D318|nr:MULTISPECIES: bifunctional 4-hydroxy-2-oxoglutarate aldolase/2-dehydro-3-deoxy-phosphogluconate aldolase [unclassified Oceanobacter]MDO6682042.1 bifunctional 4-hydroxy-2-oxoglutarate aldolase/2-dehydro-3-deoxy-phosphogluconate aldolase [Oceanobacter sp. 5_MG-2023]MDP2505563.1 bifunctional 4-hydroxy-2-oxoglutarate aldolase/2-dehydro-3-deoxy-phosphogluconate aldolase [Oceanobacter sp. 3_MG-2023]MDP2547145.1 bifunctional 4-hydroxy-2-oxoglutarate aldolase/2-dehydro-3-deoxy-phosphogluconate aldola